jgi:hypothetical protein
MMKLPRTSKGQRPAYFEDPSVDKLLTMTLALMGEVVVMRERLDSIERLLVESGTLEPGTVDGFEPSVEAIAARDAWRAQFLDIVLFPLQQEKEQMEIAAGTYDRSIELVNAP